MNREHFIQPLLDRYIKMDFILGNHDVYYKNTNEVNAPELLLFESDNINIISEPMVKEYDGIPLALVPWINNENYADSIDFLLSAGSDTCFGHFEIEGALMMPGMTCQHGLDHTYLKRFDKVYSGHFHQKSEVKNIKYLGSQMQFTWSDYGDEKYFHIFDTETREMTKIRNPHTLFEKILILSGDKDLRTIPGIHHFIHDESTEIVNETIANYNFMYQTLVGDMTDGFAGCPSIGGVKASRILANKKDLPEMWEAVVKEYEKQGLDENYALTQARLARILRASDWDSKKKKPIL